MDLGGRSCPEEAASCVFMRACVFKKISLPVSMIYNQLLTVSPALLIESDTSWWWFAPLAAQDWSPPQTGCHTRAAQSFYSRRGGAGWHLSLPWELSPIGIIQQQARFKCGHGCFSRHAFPRICVPGFTVSTVIAAWPHPHRHVGLFFHAALITLACRDGKALFLSGLLRPEFLFFFKIFLGCCRNGSQERAASSCL